MEKNNTPIVKEKVSPFFATLYSKKFIILLVVIICAGLGALYANFISKPTYEASRSVILRTQISTPNVEGSNSYEASLAKSFLPTVKACILSQETVSIINRAYADPTHADFADVLSEETKQVLKDLRAVVSDMGKISSGSIDVDYGEDSMIFTIAYQDDNPILAEAKLRVIIDVATEEIKDVVVADNVSLIPTQNDSDVTVSRPFVKFIAIYAGVGLVASIIFYAVRHFMDTTIKSKDELEAITGVSLLAQIEQYDEELAKTNKNV